MLQFNHYFRCGRNIKIRNFSNPRVVVDSDNVRSNDRCRKNSNKPQSEISNCGENEVRSNEPCRKISSWHARLSSICSSFQEHVMDEANFIDQNEIIECLDMEDESVIQMIDITEYNLILNQICDVISLNEQQISKIKESSMNEQLEGIVKQFEKTLIICSKNIKKLCDGELCQQYVIDHEKELGLQVSEIIEIYSPLFNNCMNIVKYLSKLDGSVIRKDIYLSNIIILYNDAMYQIAQILCELCNESKMDGDKLLIEVSTVPNLLDRIDLYNSSLEKYQYTLINLLK